MHNELTISTADASEANRLAPSPPQSEAAHRGAEAEPILTAPAMLAELEHWRKLADHGESPFSLLVLELRNPRAVAPAERALRKLHRESLVPLGPLGYIARRRLGVTVESGSVETLIEMQSLLRGELQGTDCAIAGYVYPFPLPEQQDDTARVSSMQSLFALPTPLGKRAFDISLALCGLLAGLPLFALLAVLIKWRSPGPVFFRQRRAGRGGRLFTMYKFRTMVVGAEEQQQALRHLNEQDGPAFKILNDPRVTPIGRFLRRTCLDELPQLWNVLRGEMSFVGPRPLPCHEADACRWWQRRRLDVTPGITCFWQARGRTLVSFDHWMRMDLEYVRKRSLGCDFGILWATFEFLLIRRYQSADAD